MKSKGSLLRTGPTFPLRRKVGPVLSFRGRMAEGMRVISLTSILSHQGRGGYFHPPVATHRGLITRNDMDIWVFSYITYPNQRGVEER